MSAMEDLAKFRHLPTGWDSYQAKMIDRAAIQTAQGLLGVLPGEWTAVPCSDGSVQLEMHDGMDIEIRISNPRWSGLNTGSEHG